MLGTDTPGDGRFGVVTLLFSDLVSSTELLGRLGDAGAEELRRTHFGLLRRAVAEHAGEEVKSLGDGLMVAFTSPLESVRCAIAMQEAIADHNREAATPALGIRVGLHAGEPARDEDDFFGTAVVVAKRLCDRAEGAQILACEVVAGLVGPGQGFSFLPVGRLRLKGLADPTAAVLVDWEQPASVVRPSRAPPERAARAAEPASPRPNRPPLVGREAELAHVEAALTEAASGSGRMAFVVGEMGVGKTRLSEEVLDSPGNGHSTFSSAGPARPTRGWRTHHSLPPSARSSDAFRPFIAMRSLTAWAIWRASGQTWA